MVRHIWSKVAEKIEKSSAKKKLFWGLVFTLLFGVSSSLLLIYGNRAQKGWGILFGLYAILGIYVTIAWASMVLTGSKVGIGSENEKKKTN